MKRNNYNDNLILRFGDTALEISVIIIVFMNLQDDFHTIKSSING